MNNPHFRTLDLNLLKVFVALFDEGSVTRAGARLGLTQSAVSHALSRLRYALGDELFVRGPLGMQPTPRASEIAPEVRLGLAHLQAAFAPPDFVPAETDRRFVLAAGSYPTSLLVPGLVRRLRSEAPNVALWLRTPDAPLVEMLDSGGCDIALGVFGRRPDRFAAEPIYADRLVWVMREDHPFARPPLRLERLAEAPHVVVASSDAPDLVRGNIVENGLERRVVLDDGVDERLAAVGLRRTIGLTVGDLPVAIAVAARSDMLTQTPQGLFELFGKSLGLVAREPPYASRAREIHAIWRKDNDGPALQWFRGLLRDEGDRFMRTLEAAPAHAV